MKSARAALTLVVSALMGAGCLNSSAAYHCDATHSCSASASCVDGLCAVSDHSCASGWRWDSSGGAQRNQCAPVDLGVTMDLAMSRDGLAPADLSTRSDLTARGDLNEPIDLLNACGTCSLAGCTNQRCGNGQAGAYCQAGSCTLHQCLVGGTLYATGAANPANPCQKCDPVVSDSSFTVIADGAACGGGTGICHRGSCCTGCWNAATSACVPGNADNQACGTMGAACQPCQACTSCGNGTCLPVPFGTLCAGPPCASGVADCADCCGTMSCSAATTCSVAWSCDGSGGCSRKTETCCSTSCSNDTGCQ